MNTKKIIEQLGGAPYLASMLGVKPTTVYKWCEKDRGIPSEYWYQLTELFRVKMKDLHMARQKHNKNRK